jgi:hypothetical protein
LFGVEETRLEPLAALPECAPEPDLLQWVERWARAERDLVMNANATTTSSEPPSTTESPAQAESPTASTEADASGVVPALFTDAQEQRFRAVLLLDGRQTQRRLIAVLVLQVQDENRRRPPAGLMAQIAALLTDHGDVKGVAYDPPVAMTRAT